MATLQNPAVEVTDDGDGYYSVKQITMIKTHSVKFKLDEEMDESTPDGRKVKTTFTLADGKLVQRQMLGGALSSELTREIVDGGKLKVTATAGDAVYIRYYTKE